MEEIREWAAKKSDEYADQCEKRGGASFSPADKEELRQMSLLWGNVLANMSSYADDIDTGNADYFGFLGARPGQKRRRGE